MIDRLGQEILFVSQAVLFQARHLGPYLILGIVFGSMVSVFAKGKVHEFFLSLKKRPLGFLGMIPASILGILSPLCMYGTIPIAASFSAKGIREDWLASFMMSSMLLNPQIIVYTAVLGKEILLLRIIFSFLGGLIAGMLVRFFFYRQPFFSFEKLREAKNRDTHPNFLIRLLLNMKRNLLATAPYFLLGIFLTALFQRYLPQDWVSGMFGKGEGSQGIFSAALVSVPLYVCGGGTVPILAQWIQSGMGPGSAMAFMLTGPATKITNLGALKMIFSSKKLLGYLLFAVIYGIFSGFLTYIIL